MRRKKASMKEIAEAAGVSVATVSRVINDNGRFSEETRQKVLRIIKEMDYRTNIVAKSLRTNISNSIGVIVPDITNEFFASIVLAIEEYCFPYGYSVLICNTNEDKEKEKMYIKDLLAKGIDGVIYISDYPIEEGDLNIPIVCVDRNPHNRNDLAVIESDNYRGGYLAGEELVKAGCKQMVVLKDYRNISVVINRMKGYYDALSKYNVNINEDLVINIEVNFDKAVEAVLKLVEEKISFDGIFATSDMMALGALTALKRSKIKVPKQVKIVGYDDISLIRHSYPAITSVRQNKDELGKCAAEVLLNMIDNGKVDQKHYVIPVSLIKREST